MEASRVRIMTTDRFRCNIHRIGSFPLPVVSTHLLPFPYCLLMIRTDSISKRFATVQAVQDLSIEARRGEVFGLLGPNGAGKSTTIRMLVDIIHPDSGTITYDGRPYDEGIRRRMGYLPEERGLYQKAMVVETIVHFARLRGLERKEAADRARSWMKRFGLEGWERRKLQELSKGNQQKVQLIITFIHQPEYLILDEPASGLDPVNQELLADIIDEMRDRGSVVLYSTHQMELAERLCNRIVLIDKGTLVLQGTPEEVRHAHGGNSVQIEFEGDAGFLGDLPMVIRADIESNFAELELAPSTTLNELLPHIETRLQLSRVERVRPSLKSIFIQATSGKTGDESP